MLLRKLIIASQFAFFFRALQRRESFFHIRHSERCGSVGEEDSKEEEEEADRVSVMQFSSRPRNH
jgi:hypothetical protein